MCVAGGAVMVRREFLESDSGLIHLYDTGMEVKWSRSSLVRSGVSVV